MTANCSTVVLNAILPSACVCAAEGDAPVCPKNGVCFRSGDTTVTYKCAREFVAGPKATVNTDNGKYCKGTHSDEDIPSLITGAGYCDKDGFFAPDCTKIGAVLGEDEFCNCGDGESCQPDNVCFTVGKTRHCYTKVDEEGRGLQQNYALVGPKSTPTMMQFGQYYDATNKRIIDTCISEFTPVSAKCTCVIHTASGTTIVDNKCKENEYCSMGEWKCIPLAELNTKLTGERACGNFACEKDQYCVNFDSAKKTVDGWSFCVDEVAVGQAAKAEQGYCIAEGKKGLCSGASTKCTTASGCECAVASKDVKSYGVCSGSDGKTCKLGQSWDGNACLDPAAPTAAQIQDKLVVAYGPIRCGGTPSFSREGVQQCYDGKMYPQCLFAFKTAEKCICTIGIDDDGRVTFSVLSAGAVCLARFGVKCPSGYEYTDGKMLNCKKSSSGGLSTGAIVGIIVAVVVVIGAAVGVGCCMKRGKSAGKRQGGGLSIAH